MKVDTRPYPGESHSQESNWFPLAPEFGRNVSKTPEPVLSKKYRNSNLFSSIDHMPGYVLLLVDLCL